MLRLACLATLLAAVLSASISGSTILLTGCTIGGTAVCGAYQYSTAYSSATATLCGSAPNTAVGFPVYKSASSNYYAYTYVDYTSSTIYAVISNQVACVPQTSAFAQYWVAFPNTTSYYAATIPRAPAFTNNANGAVFQNLVWTQATNPPPTPPPSPRPPSPPSPRPPR